MPGIPKSFEMGHMKMLKNAKLENIHKFFKTINLSNEQRILNCKDYFATENDF